MRKNLPITNQEHPLPDGAMLVSKTDLKGHITYVNDAFVEVSGFSAAELMGKAHNIVRHPDMPEAAFLDLWQTLQAGKPWTGMVKNRCKNGNYYWVLANATPIREGGTIAGYMSVRSKPSREQIAAAEAAYRLFSQNRAGGRIIREGQILSGLSASRLNFVRFLSLRQKFSLAGLGVLVPAVAALCALPSGKLAVALGLLLTGAVAGATRLLWHVTKQLRDTSAQVDELNSGRFERIFEAKGEDEIAGLQRALQALRTKVGFELADSLHLMLESTRIREALDVAQANVMVADANYDIVYGNRSLMQMLTTAESEIRTLLPNFRAQDVVGTNIDQFHHQPARQRQILGQMSGSHRTRLVFGSRKIDLIITPIVGNAGRRLGTVVEWTDRTAEISIEEEVQSVVAAACEGNLSRRLHKEGKSGFFATLTDGINAMLDSTTVIIRDVKQAAEAVFTSADEIAKGNLNLSQRTEQQASSLEETAASMEEMTTTVQHNASNAAQANELATAARLQAERGGAVVSETTASMHSINAASSKIADIIGVIDEIAFQTNLLALNAAVEAARAGEQGRGFAVVASEVRGLASRSAAAAKQIKALIEDSVAKVAQGSKLVDASGGTLIEIVASVKKVSDIVSEIAVASNEQSDGIEQVNKAVSLMDSATQQNAALVEEAAAAAQSLLDQSRLLDSILVRYRLTDDGASQNKEMGPTPPRSGRPSVESPRNRSVVSLVEKRREAGLA